MKLRRAAFCLWLLLAAGGPALRAAATEATTRTILAADAARLSAMVRADTVTLDGLLAADCLYVHSSGRVQTKPALLAALRDGSLHYAVLRYAAPPLVREFGTDTAVLTGTMQLEAQSAGRPAVKAVLLVTAVYVRQQDRWCLASYQSTVAAP